MVRCYVFIVGCCLIGVACAKFSSHSQLLKPTNRSIFAHHRSKPKKLSVSPSFLSARTPSEPLAHVINKRAINHATKTKKQTVAHHLVNARKTRLAHVHKQKGKVDNRRMIIIITSKKKPSQTGHKMNAKNSKLRSRFVKANKPAIRNHFVKAKKSTIRSHFVNAKKPTIRSHFVKATKPTIRSHFVNAKKPTIRSHFVKATANHVVKTNKHKLSLARLKRLRNTRPMLAGVVGRKLLVGKQMYPDEEEDRRRRDVGGCLARFLEGIVGSKYNMLNPFSIRHQLTDTIRMGLEHVRSGKFLLTLKVPYPEHDYHHIAINSYFSGLKNHRIRLSPAVFKTGIALGKASTFLNRFGWQYAVILDFLRYYRARAIDGDITYEARRDTLANILGGYFGAITGSPLLTIVAAQVGQLIGSAIGGPYVVPLMTLTSLIGGYGGGVAGSALGSRFFVKVIRSERLKALYRRIFGMRKKTSKPR